MKLIKNASSEKLRGGFYTPEPIASFILKWGTRGNRHQRILEPSCGDGVFLERLQKDRYPYTSVTAVEFDKTEANKARELNVRRATVINDDFHVFCNTTPERFDLVVGNPPYIRYQYFKRDQQKEAADIFEKAGLKYSKLTNAWVSFVVGSSLLLNSNGKIGFVLPAELLQVSYAKQLREFLSKHFNKINIISFEKLVFPDIQQEVVILLCEKNRSRRHLIEHIELYDANALKKLNVNRLSHPSKKIDLKSSKWTYYFLSQREINFINRVKSEFEIPTFGDYANVEVGITTGANKFFTVPLKTVNDYDLDQFVKPMVGRSVQVDSVIFSRDDWKKNRNSKNRAHLLVFPTINKLKNHEGAKKYIQYGVDEKVNMGYKTGIRDDWFVVPSIKLSQALFIRRNNIYPRLILNDANAYTTDTMHRVFIKPETDKNAFIASYYNSVSLAFAEIVGRGFGGGVLELMPSEVEEIPLPYSTCNSDLIFTIDKMLRDGKTIDEVLKITNNKILRDQYGFTVKEIALATKIWKKLSKRRLNRKHK